jgi:hypothetical protein
VPETPSERVPLLGATVEIPVTSPFPFTVTTGIAPVPPKVPTLLLTVANVVVVLTELISPVRLGILVVDVAVPVSAPTNVVAVTIPETLILVALAAPNTGVTNVGLVANTFAPLPVSSVSAVAKFADVNEPNDVVVLLDVIAPVRFGILVVDVAVPVTAPINVVAVTIPETLTSPFTYNSYPCVFVVPIPTDVVIPILEISTSTNEANCDSSLLFAIYESPPDVFIFTIILLLHILQLLQLQFRHFP